MHFARPFLTPCHYFRMSVSPAKLMSFLFLSQLGLSSRISNRAPAKTYNNRSPSQIFRSHSLKLSSRLRNYYKARTINLLYDYFINSGVLLLLWEIQDWIGYCKSEQPWQYLSGKALIKLLNNFLWQYFFWWIYMHF